MPAFRTLSELLRMIKIPFIGQGLPNSTKMLANRAEIALGVDEGEIAAREKVERVALRNE